MKTGIYALKNIITGKIYIGQSINITRRINDHFNKLSKNKHYNNHLQFAYNKYGNQSFIYGVIEYCDRSELNEAEQFWLDKFKAYKRKYGYNKSQSSSSPRGFKHSNKTKKLKSLIMKEKWKDLDYKQHIINCLKNRTPEQKKAAGNAFRGKKRPEHSKKMKGKSQKSKYTLRKEVVRINPNSPTDIKEYSWIGAVLEDGFCRTAIGLVCNKKRKTHKGYEWYFKKDMEV